MNSAARQFLSKPEAARRLAAIHFALDPGMRRIIRLYAPSEGDNDSKKPLRLLEVNEDTMPAGIQPLYFGVEESEDGCYPPTIIIEVTPEEFERIEKGELVLPEGWVRGEEYAREA